MNNSGQWMEFMVFANLIATLLTKEPYLIKKLQDNDTETLCGEPRRKHQIHAVDFKFQTFLKLEEIYAYMYYLSKDSDYIEIIQIGETHEKRPIEVMKIDFDSGACTKKAIAVEGGLRSKSWASIHIVLYIMEQLAKSTEPDINYLARNYVWYFLPVANPDGYVFSWTETCWSYNRMPYGKCIGVDLDGNFPYKWIYINRKECNDPFWGPYPASEIETRSWMTLLTSSSDPIFGYFNLLTYGARIRCYNKSLNGNLCNFANEAVKIIKEKNGVMFEAQPFEIDEGSSFEWARAHFNDTIEVVYSYHVRGNKSRLPYDEIVGAAEEIFASTVSLIFQAEPPISEYPIEVSET